MKLIAKRFAKKIVTTGGIPLVLMMSLTMCSEDNLNLQPLGTLTDQTFYNTAKDFNAATLAPYSTMLNLTYDQGGRGWWNTWLLPDDDIQPRNPNTTNDVFNWTSTSDDIGWVWQTSYTGIGRANVILDQLPKATGMADALKPRYEAEAKYMRAWWYFILARGYGDVPIVTSVPSAVDATQVSNSKPGEAWDLIEADLTFAAANLPAAFPNEKGRATKGAAQALLGKVQLFRAQWFKTPAKYQQAITNLTAAMAGPYSLTANYGDNFDEAKENNSESLFELQAANGDDINSWGTSDTGGNAGHAWTIIVSPSCSPIPPNDCAPKANGQGYGTYDISTALFNEFEPNDPRRYYTMYSDGEDYGGTAYKSTWSRTGHSAAKYNRPWNPDRFPNNWSKNNLRFIRLSDVMLMLAEAKLLGNNDVAGAAVLVNQVRARARGTPVPGKTTPAGTLPDVPAAGAVNTWFKQYLMHERRVELATEEAHRWDDLVRWHKGGLINIKTEIPFGFPESAINFNDTKLIKPIPLRELDLNKTLVQNPGY
ncbi:MAG: RagB/SusD family nutrient uptake outer membrane protein [Gemmatimonadaceae bacterium]